MAKRKVAVGGAAYAYASSGFLMTDSVDVPDRLNRGQESRDGTVRLADSVLARAKSLVRLGKVAKGARLNRFV